MDKKLDDIKTYLGDCEINLELAQEIPYFYEDEHNYSKIQSIESTEGKALQALCHVILEQQKEIKHLKNYFEKFLESYLKYIQQEKS